MNTMPTIEKPTLETQGIGAADLLESWVNLCNTFRVRRRQEIVEQVPSPQKLAKYREDLKWMLRSARAILSIAGDPDFPDRQKYEPEIAGKLLQLESYWKSLNNPMTDAEAQTLIQKHFPLFGVDFRMTNVAPEAGGPGHGCGGDQRQNQGQRCEPRRRALGLPKGQQPRQ